ncbi:hypothetical protein ACUY3K_06420 [Corynebacterium uberis]|uniref:hypothetical protein n=1 Tax=Corynebacterium TaxID=1716 RepID=UPI001D0B1939|nr:MULTISPECIES: hypothetical protein [Corynebacterium]MCZ9308187.1 hypothetical protein [Corynebacterium sp. c6VSa_13]UDL73870.1 hypothetical protein LH391_01160 [Corynebacterium uberis]UDL75247.1 hypothetical protein LH393_08255 [Corynebacterium uberis]UDL77458.1 hypothetical protein LH394_08235 [Corynebacterium uberis]UDL79744.1 hypothetical protein LH392_08665 [Corynebacterium uberis]
MSIDTTSLFRRVASVVVALPLVCVGVAPAFAADVKNERGTYTVKCQVVKNASGNPIVGLVYGNHPRDVKKAKADADAYVGKFGNDVHKRHCYAQAKYRDSGAFTVNGEPV